MHKYRDLPMDLADASVVAAAETLGTRRIFSIDGDFLVYQRLDREPFEVVPGPRPR
jgi:predicted nucleic acid-binding protein